MSGRDAYRRAVQTFSAVFVAIGIALLAVTLLNGGGPGAVGTLIGLAFVGIGIGRLWISRRMER